MLWRMDEKRTMDGYSRLPEFLTVEQVIPLDQSRFLLMVPGKLTIRRPGKRGRPVEVPLHPELAAHFQSIAFRNCAGEKVLPVLASREAGGKRGLSRSFKELAKNSSGPTCILLSTRRRFRLFSSRGEFPRMLRKCGRARVGFHPIAFAQLLGSILMCRTADGVSKMGSQTARSRCQRVS